MKELAGRLSSLDPEASQSLKVIAYFDTLVHGRVGVEGMLRGAAVLCGAPIGHLPGRAASGGGSTRGRPGADAGVATGWPIGTGRRRILVWLERTGAAHANDDDGARAARARDLGHLDASRRSCARAAARSRCC